eukprot:10553-Heterococcus_DN1.PRE.1
MKFVRCAMLVLMHRSAAFAGAIAYSQRATHLTEVTHCHLVVATSAQQSHCCAVQQRVKGGADSVQRCCYSHSPCQIVVCQQQRQQLFQLSLVQESRVHPCASLSLLQRWRARQQRVVGGAFLGVQSDRRVSQCVWIAQGPWPLC